MVATMIEGIFEALRIGVGFLWTAAWAIIMGLTVTSFVQVLALLAVPLLVAATGTAAAHGGRSYGSGMMGGSGWGLFGGAMELWGLLWMELLEGVLFEFF